MIARTEDQRKADLARIHILKAQLKLTRDQYEAVLWSIGQVESSAVLDHHGRQRVIAHLQSHVDAAAGVVADPDKPRNLQARPQLRKIAAQLHAASRTWSYARSVLEQQAGKRTIEFADSRELSSVIAALERDAQRNGRSQRPVKANKANKAK